ncbi:MAG: hypothetical protein JWQ71_213 [Pedosphaera sp.]|nr:hypothetical protein [Pedosphaera sp.]
MQLLSSRRGSGGDVEDELLELGHAAGDAGLDGAEGDFEYIGDFLVRIVLHVKEREWRLVRFAYLGEEFNDLGGVNGIDHGGRNGGKFRVNFAKFIMGKSHNFPPHIQKLPVQGGKEPGFDLGAVTQLMALGRPNIKCLLCKITSVRFRPSETECELIERPVKTSYQTFKVGFLRHTPSLWI